MFNILRSLFVIAAAVAVVGGTYAYFSANKTAGGNTITTGTLSIDIQGQNTDAVMTSFTVTGLMPGETTLVNFDVKNTSTTGVQIRGAAFGSWVTPGLDATKIKVTKVERWDGSVWATLASVDPITGIFYDSPLGDDVGNYTIPAGGKSQFQVTVKLDTTAGDAYKSQVYNASLAVQARQLGAGPGEWPTSLTTGF
ncbi:MAG: SipW-dependent-type signal peptide-containing protein [Candidatus Moranbacteria bacterium]|nr:SipW-dependent-type signal peptide-containing protein [Candidatus Moranbacteria bacterium]